jgi:hypothetical protein
LAGLVLNAAFARWWADPPAALVIVHDRIAMPIGTVKSQTFEGLRRLQQLLAPARSLGD